jgi:hypothetical protein
LEDQRGKHSRERMLAFKAHGLWSYHGVQAMSKEVYLDGNEVVTIIRHPLREVPYKLDDDLEKQINEWWTSEFREAYAEVPPSVRLACLGRILLYPDDPMQGLAEWICLEESQLADNSQVSAELACKARQYAYSIVDDSELIGDPQSLHRVIHWLMMELAFEAHYEVLNGMNSLHFWNNYIINSVSQHEHFAVELGLEVTHIYAERESDVEFVVSRLCSCCEEILTDDEYYRLVYETYCSGTFRLGLNLIRNCSEGVLSGMEVYDYDIDWV